MKKKVILILLAVIVIGLYANGQGVENYEVTTNILNVRAEANSNSEIVGKLKKKQVVQIVELNDDWSSIVFEDKAGVNVSGFVKTEYITPVHSANDKNKSDEQASKDKTWQYVFWGAFAFCLICYIIALVRTRQGKMITIVNWYDFTLLIAPFILWIIAAIYYNKNPVSNTPAIVLFVAGGICFVSSMIWSIIANKGNVFNMIVSVFAKLFVVILVWLIVLYFFRGKKTTKTENIGGHSYTRNLTAYELEIEDAKYRRNTALAIGVFGFLIFSLVGNRKHELLED